MARGWESKSVEQQQADRADEHKSARPPVSREQQERNRKYGGLLLSRSRLTQQLEAAANPRHRQMIEQSIAALNAQLAIMEEATQSE